MISDDHENATMGEALWLEKPHSTGPMTARAYATSIMEDLRRCGFDIPLQTKQGYTTQDVITVIVEAAMHSAQSETGN